MTQHHHPWCIDFEKIIQGSCPECERLYRQYPSEGHLDYEVQLEEYKHVTRI